MLINYIMVGELVHFAGHEFKIKMSTLHIAVTPERPNDG